MRIVASFDSTVGSAPAGFQTAVQAACNFFDATFSNNVTVNITFDWGALSGGAVAQSLTSIGSATYSSVRNALAAHAAATPGLSSLYLPTSDPFSSGGGNLVLTTAEARALGFATSNGSDATVTMGSSNPFNFDPSIPAVAGKYSAVSTLEHEISEVLGRQCGSDGAFDPTAYALFRYSSRGVIDNSSSYLNAYMSLDGGASGYGPVGEQGGDLADWGSSFPNDSFGFGNTGVAEPVSAADLKLMTALGWTLTPSSNPVQPNFHPNDLTYSSTASGSNHFIDLSNFEASFSDLVKAFGSNQGAMASWYNAEEPVENRVERFDGLDYVAGYSDLIAAFKSAGSMKAVQDAGASHFISNGLAEGRSTLFNGLDYIASYQDLINAFGANNDAGAYHYIEAGNAEGRVTTFDGLDYIASYSDLIKAFGANEQAGAAHYIVAGNKEGRKTTFDGLAYIANYTDLMHAFGANNDAGATHYIQAGFNEGRVTTFNVAAYEAAHSDLQGKYATNDQFLTAYINTYDSTGKFLT